MPCKPCAVVLLAAHAAALQPPSWSALSKTLPSAAAEAPRVVDAAVQHQQKRPKLSDDTVVLYRERNGWCPYSERVWLGLETKNVAYETVLIDNTGGARPSWFGSTTPRIRWADGTDQGESIDILKQLDERYPEPPLFDEHSAALIGAFKEIFPRMTRPSSRAAFLFRSSGQPVARRDFESTLEKTDALLAEATGGPFFAGATPTAPDVCWAPFLERYAAQLPLLHDGLRPRDATLYPNLSRWYDAMESTTVWKSNFRRLMPSTR